MVEAQKKVHLIGICGTAMASLAGLFQEKGFQVSGSDTSFYPPMSLQLKALKIPLYQGYSADHIKQSQPDLVIIGNVISKGNPEAEEVFRQNIAYMSLPQAMNQFVIESRHSVVIAGTHGKTTTTSLMAWTLDQMGLQPGFMVGGIPKNYGVSFKNPKGDVFVIEGDEYDTAFFDKVPKFIHYKPRTVVLTSIEFDHADIYKDLDDVKKAFIRLLELIPVEGCLVYNADDKNILSILSHAKCKTVSVSRHQGDIVVSDIHPERTGIGFSVTQDGVKKNFSLPLFGEYNAMNGAFVLAAAYELNISPNLADIFHRFAGVKRRQEIIGEPNGVLVIEDFAHHPSAVEWTLETFQKRKGTGKLHAIFEPRSATSRRNVFQDNYARAFRFADYAYIAEPFNIQGIQEAERFSSKKLVSDLKSSGVVAQVCSSTEDIVHEVQKNARPGDIVVIMSNGGFDGIYEKLLTALSSDQVAKT